MDPVAELLLLELTARDPGTLFSQSLIENMEWESAVGLSALVGDPSFKKVRF